MIKLPLNQTNIGFFTNLYRESACEIYWGARFVGTIRHEDALRALCCEVIGNDPKRSPVFVSLVRPPRSCWTFRIVPIEAAPALGVTATQKENRRMGSSPLRNWANRCASPVRIVAFGRRAYARRDVIEGPRPCSLRRGWETGRSDGEDHPVSQECAFPERYITVKAPSAVYWFAFVTSVIVFNNC